MKYFLGTIEQLVCRKMCSKHFENRLTNINVLVKNIFEQGVSVQKSQVREVNIFPQKKSKFLLGISL